MSLVSNGRQLLKKLQKVEERDLLLQRFPTCLVNPEVKTFETCSNPVIITLASLVKSFICGKHIFSNMNLSITLQGLKICLEIIDKFKNLGLGISYSDVQQFHSAWTRYEEEQNNCPREIAYDTLGTTVMDNDDFQDGTFTGSNTSHRTNVTFVQPKAFRKVEKIEKIENKNKIAQCTIIKKGVPLVRPIFNTTPGDTNFIRSQEAIHKLIRIEYSWMTFNPVCKE